MGYFRSVNVMPKKKPHKRRHEPCWSGKTLPKDHRTHKKTTTTTTTPIATRVMAYLQYVLSVRVYCSVELTNQPFSQERLNRSQRGIGEDAVGFPRPHYREKRKDQLEPAKPAEI